MEYAQIKDGVVVNVIVVDENSPFEELSKNFDLFLRVDDIPDLVGIGFTYDGETFTPPIEQDDNIYIE